MMVFVLVEGSVVIWVGGSSSSSSSAQFVRVLGELEEGFFRIERYAVVAAIVVGEYVFVCLMVGKKFSRCLEQLDCDLDWPKIFCRDISDTSEVKFGILLCIVASVFTPF